MSDPIFLVNPVTKQPQRVAPESFSALNVRERKDLEEWVLNHPEIIGERLLVITSEFAKFDRSSRRLDILAIDTSGVLVIIELKLDIACSLADQQAIRYAALCSTMTMSQVVDEFADYHACSAADAESKLCEFLERAGLPELNNRPRIILAAGSMNDPELTSAVLWLRGFGVDITCVELTPYRVPKLDELILVPRVVIPLPEARDFVINVERKEVARIQESKENSEYGSFWKLLADEFNAFCLGLSLTSESQGRYTQLRINSAYVHYEWYFYKRPPRLSVALHFESPVREQNLQWLDIIKQHAKKQPFSKDLPLLLEPWGQKWASACLELTNVETLDRALAKRAAQTMRELVEYTYPIVKSMLEQKATTLPTQI